MSIPDYQAVMLPLLKYAGDRKDHTLRQTIDDMASNFRLSDSERRELLPSGRQAIFDNRVGWARTYMKKAGLLESPKRGMFRITEKGMAILDQKPSAINVAFLMQFEAFQAFRTLRHEKSGDTSVEMGKDATPEEALESAYQSLRDELADDLLQQLKSSPPRMFEKTVVSLLVKMGYGGSLKDAGQAIGRSGDEGIDGIIKEDRLGLDIIYVQAKRWENIVGRPEVQKFAGALQGQRARKGIFITTSSFTRDAQEYASRIDSKIVLIDGEHLTQYMIDCDLGVTPMTTYEVKKLDTDFFTED
jgi:restriction system protein